MKLILFFSLILSFSSFSQIEEICNLSGAFERAAVSKTASTYYKNSCLRQQVLKAASGTISIIAKKNAKYIHPDEKNWKDYTNSLLDDLDNLSEEHTYCTTSFLYAYKKALKKALIFTTDEGEDYLVGVNLDMLNEIYHEIKMIQSGNTWQSIQK